eukprot:g284.t1
MNQLDESGLLEEGHGLTNTQWIELRKKHPILDASAFLAIVSSTAVLQAQIVATAISLFLGLLWNIKELGVIVDLFGPSVIAAILVLVVEIIIMCLLKTSLTVNDGSGIKHPVLFNFFMTVLFTVELVLGILYALWRLVLLFGTTVFVLNRLDVSLFTCGQALDNGHKTFMSMLILTVLIQKDKKQYFTEPGV